MSDRAGILVAETFVHTAIVRSRGRRWKIIRRQEVAADVPTTLQEETDLDALADVIREAVRTVEGVGLPAHLIVPSSWCFHQALAAHTRRFDDQAAAFQLEEHLPLPLEDVACAFARRANGQCTGVAIRTSPIRRLLDRLAEGAVCVERLYADSFVAAAGQRPTDQACSTLVLDQHRLAVSLITPGNLQPEVVRSVLCLEASQVAEVVGLTETVAGIQPFCWQLFDLRSEGAASPPDLSGPVEHLRRPEAAARLQLAGVEHARDLPDLCNAALAPAGGWHRTCHLAARCVMLATLLLFLWSGDLYRQSRAYRNASRLLRAREVRLTHMQIDAQRIAALRDRPQQATDRQRPNDELLAQVEHALKTAGVPVQLWQDSIPQPAQRLPQSPYQRYGTRLYFEAVTIEQVVRFACTLLAADPSLAVSSLHLVAPVQADPTTWNVDLTVSYLVYAPSGTG